MSCDASVMVHLQTLELRPLINPWGCYIIASKHYTTQIETYSSSRRLTRTMKKRLTRVAILLRWSLRKRPWFKTDSSELALSCYSELSVPEGHKRQTQMMTKHALAVAKIFKSWKIPFQYQAHAWNGRAFRHFHFICRMFFLDWKEARTIHLSSLQG